MAEKIIFKTALSKAMNLCSRMEYCTDDIRKKLQLWGVTEADADRIIKSLIEENFISDYRYARAFAKDKFRYNKWGRLKIAAHLKAKNLGGDIIRDALDEINPDDYINVLKSLIHTHKQTIKAKNNYELRAKLFRFGSSKGFESSILYDLLSDVSQTPLPE